MSSTSVAKQTKQYMPIEILRILWLLLLQGTHGQHEAAPGGGAVAGKEANTSDVLDPTDEEGGDWDVLGGDMFDGNREDKIEIVT